VRYVDDFVLLGKNNNELRKDFSRIQTFLSESLFLKLEERKTQINTLSFGVDFAGYVCFKRFARVRTRNYRRFVEKFKVKLSAYLSEELSFKKVQASFVSYGGHLSHTDSNKIKERIEVAFVKVIAKKAVQRGGNWNNGANAGPFNANLNNDPTNTNNNIGFRCCSEQEAKIASLRRYYTPHVQLQLHSLKTQAENLSLMKTGAGTEQLECCSSCDEFKVKDVSLSLSTRRQNRGNIDVVEYNEKRRRY